MNINILIVDALPENREPLLESLKHCGYSLLIAVSGEEAVSIVKSRDIALILFSADIREGISGFKLLETLRENKKTKSIPVIFMTTRLISRDEIIQAYQAGVADFLTLPVDSVVIESKVRVFAEQFFLRCSMEELSTERLRSSEAKYKSLFDTSRDGIAFMSLEGNIEKANQAYCDMLGYAMNELIFTTYQQHTPVKWRAQDSEILNNQVMKRDYSAEYKKEYIRKDGSVFPVMVRIWLVRDNQGVPLRLLKVVRDFTDQTRLEAQLRQAQKMESIGTLAGGIAHDFNNILGAIIGYAQLARYNLDDDGQAKKDIDHVLTAANRAKDLVKHILGFSRMSEHAMQPVQMHHIVKEALKLIRASLPSTIDIRQEISTGKTTIMADPTEIHQVIMNFCTNSLHAMEKTGGILTVELEPVDADKIDLLGHPDLKPGPHLRLMVSDTGCGIEPYHLDRIFDPYFTTKKKGTGTGLGLAVVHGIIKNHGGSVNVKSDPGKGTTMTVYFPRLDSIINQEPLVPEALPTGTETILFVDDELALVDIEKIMLQRLGYRVVSDSSSVSALKIFKEKPDQFDIVITDMTMPEMTGIELAREISEARPDIPIILCTGYNNSVTDDKVKEAGIDLLLLKPVEIKDLAEAIRALISGHVEA